jgi:hypothetical protein
VTEIYDCSRAPADARAGMDDGYAWATGMARTLERLERGLHAGGQRLSPGAAYVGQVSDRSYTASRTLPTGNRLSHWRHHGAHIPADLHAGPGLAFPDAVAAERDDLGMPGGAFSGRHVLGASSTAQWRSC